MYDVTLTERVVERRPESIAGRDAVDGGIGRKTLSPPDPRSSLVQSTPEMELRSVQNPVATDVDPDTTVWHVAKPSASGVSGMKVSTGLDVASYTGVRRSAVGSFVTSIGNRFGVNNFSIIWLQ